jgi:hypothetical protein
MRRISIAAVGTTVAKALTLAFFVSVMMGCGSSSNDQGTSFSLNDVTPLVNEVPLSTTDGDGTTTGAVRGSYAVQNNLARQGIRIQRINLSFFIEGSDEQPPSTTLAAGGILGPVQSEGDGSLPPGFGGPPIQTINSFVVPVEIMTWLNLNRAQLPEPPYTLTVDATVSGTTTSGGSIESNSSATLISILPDVVIEPSVPEEEAPAA